MTTTKLLSRLLAFAILVPGCSFMGSLGAAVPVPGAAALSQGVSNGAQSWMTKRAQCNAPQTAAIDPATGAPAATGATPTTPGAGTGAQLTAAATGALNAGLCDRVEKRKAKRQAKRDARQLKKSR